MKNLEQVEEMAADLLKEADKIHRDEDATIEDFRYASKLLAAVTALHWVRFETKLEIKK